LLGSIQTARAERPSGSLRFAIPALPRRCS